MTPVPSGRMTDLRRGRPSTNNLTGLEKTIPPLNSKSARLSASDTRNKPLPPTPKLQDSDTSTICSTDLGELIDLYLANQIQPYALFSEASKHLQALPFEHAPSNLPNVYNHGRFAASDSIIGNVHIINPSNLGSRVGTENDTSRYRYSEPQPCSPDGVDHFTNNHEIMLSSDPAKAYRDTLLPTPFTPISTKVPDLFAGPQPLRGPKPQNSPPLQQIPQLYPSADEFAHATEAAPLGHLSRSSLENSSDLDTVEARIKDLQTQLNQYSWERRPSDGSATSISSHEPFSYTNSFESLEMDLHMRPLPIQATHPQQIPGPASDIVSRLSTGKSSMYSGSQSEYSISPVLRPQGWSPTLKPSNPNKPRVLRSEVSPAVGLSAYQAFGPKAWEDEENREKKERKGLFGRRKNAAKNPPNEPANLNTMPSRRPRALSRPAVPASTLHGQPLASHESQSPNYAQSRPVSKSSKNDGGSSSLGHNRTRTNSSGFLSRLSPARTDDQESALGGKTLSWIASRKKKDNTNAWKEDMKKRITLVSSSDSVGLSGDSALLNDVLGDEYYASKMLDSGSHTTAASSFSPCEQSPQESTDGSFTRWI